MLIYVAGPYRAETPEGVDANIKRASDIGAALWAAGHVAFVPHNNTARYEREHPEIPEAAYLAGDLVALARCDAVVLTPDWEKSSGARNEAAFANATKSPAR